MVEKEDCELTSSEFWHIKTTSKYIKSLSENDLKTSRTAILQLRIKTKKQKTENTETGKKGREGI